MAHELYQTPRARRDLIEIWRFIADDNEAAADQVLDRMESVLAMLAENPQAGRARPELGAEIRSFAVGSYVLFYRLEGTQLVLVRVLSGALDLGQELLD